MTAFQLRHLHELLARAKDREHYLREISAVFVRVFITCPAHMPRLGRAHEPISR